MVSPMGTCLERGFIKRHQNRLKKPCKWNKNPQEPWQLAWSSKAATGTQNECLRSSQVLPPGWTLAASTSSLEKRLKCGCHCGLCALPGEPQGDGSQLPSPDDLAGALRLPTSKVKATIRRALSKHCAKHVTYRISFCPCNTPLCEVATEMYR